MESTLTRYLSPINPVVFPHLAVVLMTMGTFFTAWFFVFEVTRPRSSEKESFILKELSLSLFASLFLGFGALFLLLTAGIFV